MRGFGTLLFAAFLASVSGCTSPSDSAATSPPPASTQPSSTVKDRSGGEAEAPDVALVTGSILKIDESITLGSAVSGYRYFNERKWSTLRDVQGRNLVVFEATFGGDYAKCTTSRHIYAVDKEHLEDMPCRLDGHARLVWSIGANRQSATVREGELDALMIAGDSRFRAGNLFSGMPPDIDQAVKILEAIYANRPMPILGSVNDPISQ